MRSFVPSTTAPTPPSNPLERAPNPATTGGVGHGQTLFSLLVHKPKLARTQRPTPTQATGKVSPLAALAPPHALVYSSPVSHHFTASSKPAKMTHDAVWFSRPRKYGKGSRQWCVGLVDSVLEDIVVDGSLVWRFTAASAPTRLVSSASTASTSAVSASARRPLPSVSSRCVSSLSPGIRFELNGRGVFADTVILLYPYFHFALGSAHAFLARITHVCTMTL